MTAVGVEIHLLHCMPLYHCFIDAKIHTTVNNYKHIIKPLIHAKFTAYKKQACPPPNMPAMKNIKYYERIIRIQNILTDTLVFTAKILMSHSPCK